MTRNKGIFEKASEQQGLNINTPPEVNSMNYELEFEKAVYNLLWVWRQYNSWGSNNDQFSHAGMSSGESAAAFLERHGYGKDTGWGFEPNERAKNLMERDELSE